MECRFYDDHDCKANGSTPNLVSLFASLDKMLHDDHLCLVESSKQQIEEVKNKNSTGKTRKQRQLLSESGFVLGIAASAAFLRGG